LSTDVKNSTVILKRNFYKNAQKRCLVQYGLLVWRQQNTNTTQASGIASSQSSVFTESATGV